MVLWSSTASVLAAMLLSSAAMAKLVGPDVLAALLRLDQALPWSSSVVFHFLAFAWLAFAVWTLRPDLRGRRALVLLAMLASGAEVLQGLVSDRSSNWNDVFVNLLGSSMGLLAGATHNFPGRLLTCLRTALCVPARNDLQGSINDFATQLFPPDVRLEQPIRALAPEPAGSTDLD